MKFIRAHTRGIGAMAALTVLGFILTADGRGMSMFSDLVLFSRVEGVVTENGEPVEGAEIVQEVLYKEVDEVPPVSVTTGSDGTFVLEEITHGAGLSGALPGQISIVQRLVIRHGGKEYQGWRHNKSSVERNSELDGRPLKLVCELTTPPDFEGTHFGICRAAKD